MTSQDLSSASEKGKTGLDDHFVKISLMDLAPATGHRESCILTPPL